MKAPSFISNRLIMAKNSNKKKAEIKTPLICELTRHLILPEKRVQFCGVSVRVRASEQQLRCELVGGVASW